MVVNIHTSYTDLIYSSFATLAKEEYTLRFTLNVKKMSMTLLLADDDYDDDDDA